LHRSEHRLLSDVSCVAERLEVLQGPTGRRSWPAEVKARIVMESFAPGAIVAEVARHHGLNPQQLSDWRGQARKGKLVLPVDDGPAFAALELEELSAPRSAGPIEIEAGGVTVRLPGDSSAVRIAEIAAALRGVR
jgi:transposase